MLLPRHLDTSKNQGALSAHNAKISCKRVMVPQLFFDHVPEPGKKCGHTTIHVACQKCAPQVHGGMDAMYNRHGLPYS